MSAAEAISIPYQQQSDPQTKRSCGAACLGMVYRSLGKDVTEAEIWPAIAKQSRFGSFASTTHLMAQDAWNRGFAALAIQTRHPLQALKLCRDSRIRAVLNHRLKNDATTGHYSVLVDIDERNVVLHDPLYGPSRHLPHAELLALWQRRFCGSEIMGNVLIGISAHLPDQAECQLCHTPIPASVKCPQCDKPVYLQPAPLLGCMNSAWAGRMWNYLCCPACDYMWTFSLQPSQAKVAASDCSNEPVSPGTSNAPPPEAKMNAASQENPLSLDSLFDALDKFCNHILSQPATANHPEIKQQLDFIVASKEKLTLAVAEQTAQAQARREQQANLVRAAKQKNQAHRKRVEELNRPLPPLDGNALGRTLLQNLGYID